MIGRAMEARSPARYLAPIALVVSLAGAYLIVHHYATQHATASSRTHVEGSGLPPAKFYVVQPGDNLTSIAARHHVSLVTIEALNPTLDANSLQAGQRIRLRR